jgi:signal transduction histidine kinase
MIDSGVRDSVEASLVRALGLTSFIIVPLIAREAKLGTLTIVMAESGRRFDDRDLEFAMDLGRRAALAIDNARTHEQLRAKTVELEIRAGQLKKANDAKMEFLAVMSHELRTPLNAINGYTDLMEMGIGGAVSDAQREYLMRIKKSGKFLLGLINDVLNFVRIDAASVSIKHEPVQLDPILDTSHMLVEPQMKARRIGYRYEALDGPCMVLGDSEKIEQVILNLLTNAVKFTDPGGEITLSCESRGGRARISVADTGRGIPASKLESVFDPFVQLDRGVNPDSQQGVGLGLAISRGLARAMGGELTAESEVGKGSVFILDLELSPASPQSAGPDFSDETKS